MEVPQGEKMEDEQCSTLHHACRVGRSDIAQWILAQFGGGGVVDDVDEDGDTPLLCACRCGHLGVARVLLHHGATIDEVDFDGATPLHCASGRGHHSVARLLINYGADIDGTDDDGATPIHYASRAGHAATVRVLILQHADVSKGDFDGHSPLHYACEAGHERVVRNLLMFGAGDPELLARDYTPLQEACRNGHVGVARLLIECEAYPYGAGDDRGDDGCAPLHYASTEGVARLLLHHGAEVDDTDNDGATPLHHASWRGSEAVVRVLLEHGADAERRNGYRVVRRGRPLDWARKGGNLAVVELLSRWLDFSEGQRRGIILHGEDYWRMHFLAFTGRCREGRGGGKPNQLDNLPHDVLERMGQCL